MGRLVFTVKVWLAVWFLVTFFSYCIRWLELSLPLVGQTFIITIIIVPIMVYGIIPFLSRNNVSQPESQDQSGSVEAIN